LHRVVRIELTVLVLLVLVHGGHVARPAVPLAVIVVRHHTDVVQVAVQGGDVVRCLHHGATGTDGRGEQQLGRLECGVQLPQPAGESGLIRGGAGGAVHLPADWVLPVKVQAVKVVVCEELYGVLYEGFPAVRAAHKPAVLVPLAVVPAAQRQQHLPPPPLQPSHLLVKLIVKVCPAVMRPNGERFRVQYGESVNNVGAEVGLNVCRLKLSLSGPVPGPVGEVTNYTVRTFLALLLFLLLHLPGLLHCLGHLTLNREAGGVRLGLETRQAAQDVDT